MTKEETQTQEYSSESDSSSNFSLELVVDNPKEEETVAENNVDANIYDFDLDTIKDKPWLKPGTDITDYFNYGFTEKTWKKYCEMQRDTRQFTERENKADRSYNEQSYGDRSENRYYKRRRIDEDRYSRGPRRY